MLKPGLYCVATPIGNLQDITLRALDVLKECDILVCEDTRVSSKLLSNYSIHGKLLSYHDHNAETMRPKILKHIDDGKRVALLSDAGTPLINDPGTKLVRACYAHNFYVTTLPGPCSVPAALVLSGLMNHTFTFLGFYDKKKTLQWQGAQSVLVFFESPHRLVDTLNSLQELFPKRPVAVVREISKMYEEAVRGSFDDVIHHFQENAPRGEIVIVLGIVDDAQQSSEEDIDADFMSALENMSFKDAVDVTSKIHGLAKKDVYRRGLSLQKALLEKK